jgi:predicted dehydrogenase
MKEINIGIIGVGNMGSAHLECIYGGRIKGMRVTAVCDTDERRLSEAGARYPGIELYSDYRQMLKKSRTDAVIVAVPHPLHAEIGTHVLESGRHLLCEKPIDISVSAAQKLCSAAEKSGRVFGIMFNQRTNALYRKAREIVKSGGIGELTRTVWIITNWFRTQAYYDSGGWRATWAGEGGGVLINQAPHNLDLWQWICGMPAYVTAFCRTAQYHKIEVEDDATLYTEYANGATGVFITSTGEYPGTNRLEISGTRGKIVLENGVLRYWRLAEDERTVSDCSENAFCTVDSEYAEYTDSGETGHEGILRNFADAVLNGAELLAPGADGINELTLSNAAYLSEWQGNRKITLPFDSGLFDRLLAEKAAASRLRSGADCSPENPDYLERWRVRW